MDWDGLKKRNKVPSRDDQSIPLQRHDPGLGGQFYQRPRGEVQNKLGTVPDFLGQIKSRPTGVSDQEALELAKKLGMKDQKGFQVVAKVKFLLNKFAHKDETTGKWMIDQETEIKPPFFSESSQKTEMPHFDSDRGSIDLQIEKYPMSSDEKGRLMRAFQKHGLVGELHGELLHFKPDHTVDVADEGMVARLPKLPPDWLRFMKVVEDK